MEHSKFSDASELFSTMISLINQQNSDALSIILDGEYFTSHGKMVYVGVEDDSDGVSQIVAYTIASNSMIGSNREPVENFRSVLLSKLVSQELYDIRVNLQLSLADASVKMCAPLRMLVFESGLYKAAKDLAQNPQNRGVILTYGNIIDKEATALTKAFKDNSFRIYDDLVYGTKYMRLRNTLLRHNNFYSIQKSFVPVFIDFSYVYNPLKDPNERVEKTAMYDLAVKKNRKLVVDDDLSCYVLTHKEICEAFGMKNFMRFTSELWYKVFIGLLKPTLSGFPRLGLQSGALGYANDYVFVSPSLDSSKELGLRARYTALDMVALLNKLKEQIASGERNKEETDLVDKNAIIEIDDNGNVIDTTATEETATVDTRISPADKLQFLNYYNRIDTLTDCVQSLFNNLTTFGPAAIDVPDVQDGSPKSKVNERVTVAALRNYLSEAKIYYVQ